VIPGIAILGGKAISTLRPIWLGAEAIQLSAELFPDLILMDIVMEMSLMGLKRQPAFAISECGAHLHCSA